MARLTKGDALAIAREYDIPLDVDFFALGRDKVHAILDAADAQKYRAPRNANGSRARYFHAYLCRAAGGSDHG